jgi:hypothetical protein
MLVVGRGAMEDMNEADGSDLSRNVRFIESNSSYR